MTSRARFKRELQRAAAARFQPADHELTNEEIQTKYGALISEGVAAFAVDPVYAIRMAESAARIAVQRERLAAYWEGKRGETESAQSSG